MLTQDITTRIRTEAAKVLVGQEDPFTHLLIALLSGGHVLLEGVPGTAKTLMAKTLAALIQADFKRVQFTPDLMPSDVIGTQIFELGSGQFHLRRGPVFTSVLLGDEINRAPAKTQSALLEAMEERQVTIEGQRLVLPDPFFVVATQNPVEYEGTYPLPEAQLDRFLLEVSLGYPTPEEEARMLEALAGAHPIGTIGQVVPGGRLPELQTSIWEIHVQPSLRDYLIRLANATRVHPDLALGVSPRATFALFRAAQAYAALAGREFVLPDDIKALVRPVWQHRLMLRPESALRGRTAASILDSVLAETTLDLGEQNA